MEAFSCLLKRAVAKGFLTSCMVWGRRGEGVQISHLLFTDDMLIFCEAKEDQLTHLCWLLMWFEALSGLKVNMEKSELIPVGRVENMGELADEFGYKVGILPSTYLGMPLGAPFKSIGVWDGIEERFKKKIGYVEATIHLERRNDYFNSKYSIQPTDLFYVNLPFT